MSFLDANIFIRFLTADDATMHEACVSLFEAIAEGKMTAWTTDLTIAEVVFVLSSRQGAAYGFSREKIRDALLPLLRLPHLRLGSKALYPRIFDLYTSIPIDFIDAYLAALVEQVQPSELYSYDRDFDKSEGINRKEPASE